MKQSVSHYVMPDEKEEVTAELVHRLGLDGIENLIYGDEPSSNLDASSILDLRATLAFWKSQGKTVIVSEHRLYYLRGLADRFIYITAGLSLIHI